MTGRGIETMCTRRYADLHLSIYFMCDVDGWHGTELDGTGQDRTGRTGRDGRMDGWTDGWMDRWVGRG